jgi:phosphoribosylaminoimidazolecarboxamide formyltransferase/IMP cyclohydrolase
MDMDGALLTLTRAVAHRNVNGCSWKYIAVGVKHGNACGAAVGNSPAEVIDKMTTGDSLSLFGGFVMTNFEIGYHEARALRAWGAKPKEQCLLDGVVAPGFSQEGCEILRRKDGCQFYVNESLATLSAPSCMEFGWQRKQVRGGEIVQPINTFVLDLNERYIEVFGPPLTEQQRADLALAYPICATSNSNTVTAVLNGKTQANAVGQQDRVGAVALLRYRAKRSGNTLRGAVGSHDSFIPYPDAAELMIEDGFSVIFITRGGRRFEQVLELFLKAGLTVVVAADEIARGFCKHGV